MLYKCKMNCLDNEQSQSAMAPRWVHNILSHCHALFPFMSLTRPRKNWFHLLEDTRTTQEHYITKPTQGTRSPRARVCGVAGIRSGLLSPPHQRNDQEPQRTLSTNIRTSRASLNAMCRSIEMPTRPDRKPCPASQLDRWTKRLEDDWIPTGWAWFLPPSPFSPGTSR